MSHTTTLSAEKREQTGKKVKQLRADGKLPATVYEKGKDSLNIQVEFVPMVKVFEEVGYGQPVSLTVDGKKYLTMIKDVDIDPAKHVMRHVAFHAVNANEAVEAEIPVHLIGEVPAEKIGNFIVRPNETVMVKALPGDLPEAIEISAERLENQGDTIIVEDLTAPDKVEIISEPSMPIAVVEEPRAQEEPEEAEDVDAADVPSDNGGEEAAEGDSEAKTDE